jgi:ribosomal protein S4
MGLNLTPLLPAGTRRKKLTSLYSCFQLESALSRLQEKRSSALLLQLMERKKLRILYGNLSNRETNTLIIKATKGRGRFGDILFRLLESRLDVVLCKIGFFPTIPFARQSIYYGKVLVNCKVMNFANYLLQPGDVISIAQAYRHIVKNYIDHKTSAFSICLLRDSKPQTQPKDKTDRCLSATKTALHPFPWFKDYTSLEGMMPHLSIIGVEAQTESRRWGCIPPFTGESRREAGWKTAINYQDRKEGKYLIDVHLTLLELLGNSAITRAHWSNKGRFCLATWQYRQEVLRNRLRLVPPKLPHLEVSYRLFKAVYLYPTQRAAFPAIIDVERILNP